MKYQVSELECGELDAAVAQALKYPFKILSDEFCTIGFGSAFIADPLLNGEPFEPSSDWAFGGPIIEREAIELWKWVGSDGAYWVANVGGRKDIGGGFPKHHAIGVTPLIAAMRALVVSRLGAEVEL